MASSERSAFEKAVAKTKDVWKTVREEDAKPRGGLIGLKGRFLAQITTVHYAPDKNGHPFVQIRFCLPTQGNRSGNKAHFLSPPKPGDKGFNGKPPKTLDKKYEDLRDDLQQLGYNGEEDQKPHTSEFTRAELPDIFDELTAEKPFVWVEFQPKKNQKTGKLDESVEPFINFRGLAGEADIPTNLDAAADEEEAEEADEEEEVDNEVEGDEEVAEDEEEEEEEEETTFSKGDKVKYTPKRGSPALACNVVAVAKNGELTLLDPKSKRTFKQVDPALCRQ